MLKEPQIADLRLFTAVVKHASFVKAARELNLAQTTVSKRIAVLEQSLGTALLLRTTRSVSLTDAGQTVYDWSRRMLDHLSDLHDELADEVRQLQGPLRISASPRLGKDYVAPALSRLKQRFSGLEIWLELINRPVNLIDEGFHLDIRSGNTTDNHLIGHRIVDAARILCAAPGYLEQAGQLNHPADLEHHQCLLFRDRNEPFGVWTLQGPNGNEDIRITGSMASNDNDVIRSWAEAGHGIMIAADWFVASSLAAGRLQRVLPDWQQQVDVWAISAQRSSQSVRVRLVLEYLRYEMNRP